MHPGNIWGSGHPEHQFPTCVRLSAYLLSHFNNSSNSFMLHERRLQVCHFVLYKKTTRQADDEESLTNRRIHVREVISTCQQANADDQEVVPVSNRCNWRLETAKGRMTEQEHEHKHLNFSFRTDWGGSATWSICSCVSVTWRTHLSHIYHTKKNTESGVQWKVHVQCKFTAHRCFHLIRARCFSDSIFIYLFR